MKKIFTAVLAMIFSIIPLIGCGNKLPDTLVVPVYEDNGGGFRIAAYRPPFGTLATDEQYRYMSEANINYVYGWDDTTPMRLSAMDLCQKYGMKYLVFDLTDSNIRLNAPVSDAILNAYVAKMKEVSAHQSFGGAYLIDEPSYYNADNIKAFYEVFTENFPGYEMMVNMHPSWQGATAHVGPNGYQGYMEAVYEAMPQSLSYDNYPMNKTGIAPSYVQNLDIVARYAKEKGVPFYNYIQTLPAYGKDTSRMCDSYEDIAWQFNVSMAYGIDGMQTFTYLVSGNSGGGLVDTEGNRTSIYNHFKAYTDELVKWDFIYSAFRWDSTMLLKKPGTRLAEFDSILDNVKTHARIDSIEYSEHLMAGVFKDANELDGFYLVNYTDPMYALSNNVKIKFKDAEYALVYEKGIRRVVSLKNGSYETVLSCGGAQFIIPFNG